MVPGSATVPSIDELCSRARALPYRFPPGTERVQLTANKSPEVAALAAGVTPLCTSALEVLLADFLKIKRQQGSALERDLYANMSAAELFTRLLVCRPLGFWGPWDRYVLATTCDEQGNLLSSQWGGFENIGTEAEEAPLVLASYLSYDEMALGALVSVAVPTRFISSGDRALLGSTEEESGTCALGEDGSFVSEGVIVGCVGARLVKPGRMEAAHLLVTPDRTPESVQNSQHWARLYGEEVFPHYAEAQQAGEPRFHALPCAGEGCCGTVAWHVDGNDWCEACMASWYACKQWPGEKSFPTYLDTKLYKLRIHQSVAPFLAFANQHGAGARGAHVRIKGLGLGVWQVDAVQEVLMKQVYQELLDTNAYPGIAVLEFAWFSSEALPKHDRIKIFISKAGFADPIEPGTALVVMYAWDGNAYPGNEWWAGKKGMTDDSAAASCSLIASLQHPKINRERLCAQAAQVLDSKLENLRPFRT